MGDAAQKDVYRRDEFYGGAVKKKSQIPGEGDPPEKYYAKRTCKFSLGRGFPAHGTAKGGAAGKSISSPTKGCGKTFYIYDSCLEE